MFLFPDWNDYHKFIIPLKYAQSIVKSQAAGEECNYLLTVVQNQMRQVLYSFLNNAHPCPGLISRFFYPNVLVRIRKRILDIKTIVLFLKKRRGWFASYANYLERLSTIRRVDKQVIAHCIVSYYRDLNEAVVHFTKKQQNSTALKSDKNLLCPSSFKKYRSNEKYFKPIIDLKKFAERNLAEHSLAFYLHGSLATDDYIETWSDIDTLLIVRKESLMDVARLLTLARYVYYTRNFLYKFNHLHLHGIFVCAELDLLHYANAYFPVDVLNSYGLLFSPVQNDILVNRRDDKFERIHIFWNDAVSYFLQIYGKYLRTKKISLKTNYDRMLFLHRILTFPLFFLQSINRPMYKKHSFDVMSEYFPEDELIPIRQAESIRSHWRGKTVLPSAFKWTLNVNPRLGWALLARLDKASGNYFEKYNIQFDRLLEQMIPLCKNAFDFSLRTSKK